MNLAVGISLCMHTILQLKSRQQLHDCMVLPAADLFPKRFVSVSCSRHAAHKCMAAKITVVLLQDNPTPYSKSML